MQLWKKMKKNRKGFTLVEIIVVLVILAILAAFTIPAMLGFVNDAKMKAEIANAREVYVAAQSAATELKAGGKTLAWTDDKSTEGTMANRVQTMLGTDVVITPVATEKDVVKGATGVHNVYVVLEMDGATPAAPTGRVLKVIYGADAGKITIDKSASSTGTSDVVKW